MNCGNDRGDCRCGDLYQDCNGINMSLDSLCRIEPEWAANRIRFLMKQVEELTILLEKNQKNP